MIPSSTINDVSAYAPGWLGRYCDVMGRDVAPWSFHLLAAMLAMSSVVGRRAALVRPAGTLWPPTSILLLSPSGVGKSLALLKAYDIIKLAAGDDSNFYLGFGGFTVAGVREAWRVQQRRSQLDRLEGVHIEDEIATILKERTGTETITSWLLRCLAHGDLIELLRGDGRVEIKGMTVAFGFGSTIAYLRRSVSIDEFTGGLMHRFLIGHEGRQRDNSEEATPTEAQVRELVAALRSLRDSAPTVLTVAGEVEKRLRMLRSQARRRSFDSIHLTGYWNRYDMLVLKLASLYAIANGTFAVTNADCDVAASLLDTKIYPVLEGVIDEVAATHQKKRLLELADSVVAAGEDGWPLKLLFKKLDAITPRGQNEQLQAMLASGLLFQHGRRVYGRQDWVIRAKGEEQ